MAKGKLKNKRISKGRCTKTLQGAAFLCTHATARSSPGYIRLSSSIQQLFTEARRQAARSVNAVLTATYWEIGRKIVKFEQGGMRRAGYGEVLLTRLSHDLTRRFGRGFSVDNLETMRAFYIAFPLSQISETVSRKFNLLEIVKSFPLSWSHYVLLVKQVRSDSARDFYHIEAIRGGWSVRQLGRQIDSQFYERTALSRNKMAMLTRGSRPRPTDRMTPEDEIKDPYVLEFLGLKDEYSEHELEEALIRHLESFLLELGSDFAFIGRQRRLRIGSEWYRVDLVFYHRLLRCLVLIDLKLGKFSHADAGQMHLYLNYARENWTRDGENPPVGIILCASKDEAVARYALDGLPNKVLASEYRTALPPLKVIEQEIKKTRRMLSENSPRCSRLSDQASDRCDRRKGALPCACRSENIGVFSGTRRAGRTSAPRCIKRRSGDERMRKSKGRLASQLEG